MAVSYDLQGDQAKALTYMNEGLRILFFVKAMKRGIDSNSLTRRYNDGTIIHVQSFFDNDIIHISSPYTGEEIIMVEDITLHDRLFLYCDFGCTIDRSSCVLSPCFVQTYDIIYYKKNQNIELSPSLNTDLSYEKAYCNYLFYEDVQSVRGEHIDTHTMYGPFGVTDEVCNPRGQYHNFTAYVITYETETTGDPIYLWQGQWGNYEGQYSSRSLRRRTFSWLGHVLENLRNDIVHIDRIFGVQDEWDGSLLPDWSYYGHAYREYSSRVTTDYVDVPVILYMGTIKFVLDHHTIPDDDQFIVFYDLVESVSDNSNSILETGESNQEYHWSGGKIIGNKEYTYITESGIRTDKTKTTKMVINTPGMDLKAFELCELTYEDVDVTQTNTHVIQTNVGPGYFYPESESEEIITITTTSSRRISGTHITDISCQINDEFLVYTYDLWEKDYYEYGTKEGSGPATRDVITNTDILLKRVIGYVNIANENLQIGFHKTFEYPPFDEDTKPNLSATKVDGVTEIPDDTDMYVRILAFNPCSTSAFSNEVHVSLSQGEKIGHLKISWGAIPQATGYIVFINDYQWKVIMGNKETSTIYYDAWTSRSEDAMYAFDEVLQNKPSIGVDFL